MSELSECRSVEKLFASRGAEVWYLWAAASSVLFTSVDECTVTERVLFILSRVLFRLYGIDGWDDRDSK